MASEDRVRGVPSLVRSHDRQMCTCWCNVCYTYTCVQNVSCYHQEEEMAVWTKQAWAELCQAQGQFGLA